MGVSRKAAKLAKRSESSQNLVLNQKQDLLSFATLRLCEKISCRFEKNLIP
jgi:hypothetical protein